MAAAVAAGGWFAPADRDRTLTWWERPNVLAGWTLFEIPVPHLDGCVQRGPGVAAEPGSRRKRFSNSIGSRPRARGYSRPRCCRLVDAA